MQSLSSNPPAAGRVVVLGTGGTIAGTAARSDDPSGYTAAQLGVAELVAQLPSLAGVPLACEQLAQLDSKDMSAAVWARLAARVAQLLAEPAVAGIVVTHGTDTLEETAYLLQRVLAPARPVVLAAAMRPATSVQADGPQNLLDAITLARHPGARGVLACLGGAVWRGDEVRKSHTYRIEAFDAGDAGALGYMEAGRLRQLRDWPAAGHAQPAPLPAQGWPWVEIVTSTAEAQPRAVQALVAAGVQGLVVAATGGGTVHHALQAALAQAQAQGVAVLKCSRVAAGGVRTKPDDDPPGAGALTPAQARVELMLRLLERGVRS